MGRETESPPEYRAPSWSWASIDERFLHGSRSFCGFCWWRFQLPWHFIDYHVDLKGENSYGEVKSGWMKLRALVECFSFDDKNMPYQRYLQVKARIGNWFSSYCMLDTIQDDVSSKLYLSALILAQSEKKGSCMYQVLLITAVDGKQYPRVGKIIFIYKSWGSKTR